MNFYHINTSSFHKGFSAKKIALMGMLLSMIFVLHYLTEFFAWPLATFLKFDFSLLPVIVALFLFNFWSAFMLIIIRFCFELLLSHDGVAFWYGPLVQIIIAIVFLLCLTLFWILYSHIVKQKALVLILTFVTSTVIIVLFGTLINWLWATPLYMRLLLSDSKIPVWGPNFASYYSSNAGLHSWFGGISNWTVAAWTIFTPFNLVKFAAISIMVVPCLSLLLKRI